MSLPNTNITVGAPPLLWSDVYEAFTKINENFDSIAASLGVAGIIPINFETLDTSLKPTASNLYDLGDTTHQWRSVFTAEHTTTDPLNGLWAGSAQVKGVGYTINLPTASTVGGDPLTGIGADLIIDPNKTFFKEIQVNNDLSVVATTFGDTVNFLSSSGIGLAVSSGADSITFSNTGILSIIDGLGIASSTVSGVSTITNAGVRSLQSTVALPAGRTTGAGINITGSTGDNLRITNAGVISISSGVGITVSADAATGDVTITNSAPAVNSFTQIQVDGDTANRLQADAVSDVLNINSGEGITLTKNVGTDTLTIAVNPVFDLKGSVFGDDSSILVDAVSNYIYGNVSATTLRTAETKIALGANAGSIAQGAQAVAIGSDAGNGLQGNTAVAVGSNAGRVSQGIDAVALGFGAGETSQGLQAVAIGAYAGATSQPANTIILNASGSAVNGVAAQTNSFYVAPIRTTANGTPLMYNSTTKEITYSTVLEFAGSTISTSDSSGLTVDVQTTFNTDVTVENDLDVTQRLRVQGSRVINITELQAIVAACADFTAFKTAIAGLV